MKENSIKIFLDDVREPKDCVGYMYHRIGAHNLTYYEEWVVVRNYEEFVQSLHDAHNNGIEVTHISFDHDLASDHYNDAMYVGQKAYEEHLKAVKEKTGLDCAKFLKEMYEHQGKSLPTLFIHSMNPVGMENIKRVFE